MSRGTVDYVIDRAKGIANRNLDEINDNVFDWYNDVQDEVCRAHKFWFLSSQPAVSITAGTSSYALSAISSVFKSAKCLYYTASDGSRQKIDLKDYEDCIRFYASTTVGAPEVFAWDPAGDNLIVFPKPDAAYTATLTQSGYLAALTTGQSNILTQKFPHVMIDGLLREIYKYLEEDDKQAKYNALFKGDPQSSTKIGIQEIIAYHNERELEDIVKLIPHDTGNTALDDRF